MAYTLSEIRPDDKRGQTKLRTLLEGEGITLDGNLDYTCGLFDEDYQLGGHRQHLWVHPALLCGRPPPPGRGFSTRWSLT